MKSLAVFIAALTLTACGLLAQSPTMSCSGRSWSKGSNFCEVREVTIASLPTLLVDGNQNGGVSIKGANRSDILVRAMVQTHGNSESEAKSLGSQVIVHTSAGTVKADGPKGSGWSVTYEIFVPLHTNLNLKTHNGGVAIAGVESSMEFHSVNGGISLKDVGGSVKGETVNGGVSLQMTNTRLAGQGIDVQTQNGGISMKVPERLSAQLDVATVNGGLNVRLPNTAPVAHGDHRLNVTLGSGGPTIRIRTHNGGISVAGAAA